MPRVAQRFRGRHYYSTCSSAGCSQKAAPDGGLQGERGASRRPCTRPRCTRTRTLSVNLRDRVTLWVPMMSGKQPRNPLYSWLHSIRKWRSFLGCNKTQTGYSWRRNWGKQGPLLCLRTVPAKSTRHYVTQQSVKHSASFPYKIIPKTSVFSSSVVKKTVK